MRRINLDLDVLRSFAVGMELGSFAKAAERLGSLHFGGERPTQEAGGSGGRRDLPQIGAHARTDGSGRDNARLRAPAAGTQRRSGRRGVHGVELEGWVRLGLQEDFSETLLTEVLGRFMRAHPKVRIEARVARNAELIERVVSARLDLALAWSDGALTPHCERVAETPMCWIGSAKERDTWPPSRGEALPLAALEAPCLFRQRRNQCA